MNGHCHRIVQRDESPQSFVFSSANFSVRLEGWKRKLTAIDLHQRSSLQCFWRFRLSEHLLLREVVQSIIFDVECFHDDTKADLRSFCKWSFDLHRLHNFIICKQKLEARVFYKYGTIYREVIHTPRVDWCQIMREGTSNIVFKAFFNLIKDNAPSVIHPCPYTVRDE